MVYCQQVGPTSTLNKCNTIYNNSPQHALNIGCDKKHIEEPVNTKFLGLQIDDHFNWKNHINQMIPKLSRACYAVRSFHIRNNDTLKSVSFAFHPTMKYGIILLFNSSYSKIFT
jgi:hypothetical protein